MSIYNSLANEMLYDIILGFETKFLTRLTNSVADIVLIIKIWLF